MAEPALTRRDLLSLLAGAAVLPPAAASCERGPAKSSLSQAEGPLHYSSLANVARRIAAAELTSTILTRQMLDRIAAVDGHLLSYVTVMTDRATASAERADAEISRRPVSRASSRRAHRS